jgi:tRNA A-37 threonylcarbamoyl transferase component Bud32
MPGLIGQSLGRYHILEQLGEGGMATVYKAYDTRLEREVAVKLVRRGAFPPEQLDRILKRFEQEAKALARLTHPNIVGVIDYGEFEGAPYLVMPYLPGGTLKQLLGKPVSWQKAAQLLIPIARALEYAHKQGMIHRDVKPSNILISQSGEPFLSDFGIAKLLENEDAQTLTGTGLGVGTPEYMAPEQWTGKVGPQSDLYSLGIVFYELVTGRKPYVADTPAAVLLKQTSDPLPNPRKFVTDLPQSVERVLIKALARDPADRYASMKELAAALENLLTNAPTGAAGEQPAAHVPGEKKRPARWLWGAIAGILVLSALGVGLFFLNRLRSGPPAELPSPTACSNQIEFVTDVTIPDGTVMDSGQAFIKTWRLKNSGTCTWTRDYDVVFDRGDNMGAPADYFQPIGDHDVAPGEAVDVTIQLTAPAAAGTSTGYWRLQDPHGNSFGIGSGSISFYVSIGVASNSPQVILNDDFSDPSSGWKEQEFSDGGGSMYSSGNFQLKRWGETQWAYAQYREGMESGNFSDFSIQVDVTPVQDNVVSGIVFRRVSPYEFYVFQINTNGYFRLLRAGEADYLYWAPLIDWTESTALKPGISTNRLMVIALGDTFSLYANGQPLSTIQDDSYPHGWFGLFQGLDEMGGVVNREWMYINFDNARISVPRLVLDDDFSDPGSGWTEQEFSAGGGSNYNSGSFQLKIPDKETQWAYAQYREGMEGGNFSDFSFQVDVIIEQYDGVGGIVFRRASPYEFYVFQINTNGYYQLLRAGDAFHDNWTILIDWTQSYAVRPRDYSTNRLMVIALGDTFYLYANGQYLDTFQDSSYPRGWFGLFGGCDDQGGCVNSDWLFQDFDNARIVVP